MQLAHLNWQEAEKVLADPETLVVIPVGSTEQHGPIGYGKAVAKVEGKIAARCELTFVIQ